MKREELFLKRLKNFSISVIIFCRKIKHSREFLSIVNQMVRSATSIGANYTEAINSISEKEFRSKIYICKKEAEETKYWLEIIRQTLFSESEIDSLLQESKELCLIFQKITFTLNKKQNKQGNK